MFRFLTKKGRKAPKVETHGGTKAPRSLTISPDGRASLNEDGVVFLHLRRGVLFKSNPVGARIWQGLLEHESPETMAAQISSEYSVPIELATEDTARFLAELQSEGFLARNGGL